MSSPSIQHSVSDPTLVNSYFPVSGSYHTPSPKRPSSSKIAVVKPRIGRKNDAYNNMDEDAGCSPYYKGLTDQSLAICKAPQAQLASSDYHQSHHPSNIPLSSPECSSPYYKGLIDYTLAISAKQLASDGSCHDLDHSQHSGGSLPCECSPYYKGLTDYTLALYEQQLASHGSSAFPGFDSNPNFINIPSLEPSPIGFHHSNLFHSLCVYSQPQNHISGNSMSSPSIQHSVSDPTLVNSSFPGSGSYHTPSPKRPSSSEIAVMKPRIGNKNDAYNNMDEDAGCSPYYKGLTDQSLAICKAAQAQLASSDYHQSHHPSNIPLSSPECSSPYYKGLIDYTLAISAKQLASDGSCHDLDHSQHSGGSLPFECSPYYKGLIDYTLALYGQQLASHGSSAPPGFDSNPNFINIPSLEPSPIGFHHSNLFHSLCAYSQPQNHISGNSMSSPSIQHSVSDPTLVNSSFPGSGSYHTPSPKRPSSSEIAVVKPRIGNKNDAYNNMDENAGCSPYYKGLTDQSLAICKAPQAQLASSDYHQSHHPGNIPLSSPECSSPYYKGLIDYTLAISAKQLASDGSFHDLDHSQHSGGSLPCECSPYYKGLTDYTLALYGQQLASHGSSAPPGFDSNLNFINIPSNLLTMCFTRLNPGPGYSSSSSPESKNDVSNQMELEKKEVNGDLGLLIEEMPLRERVSEPSIIGKVQEETAEIITTSKVSNYGLVGEEEKPLRESISVSEQRVASELRLKNGYENQEKYTWANKYQPQSLGDFICNKEKALQLQEMVREGCSCKHFIFEGPPGVGKVSMIRCMLREVFGTLEIKEETKSFKLKGEMVDSIEMNIKRSTHHVEVNLSDTKGYEKHVLVDLFKETYETFLNPSAPCSPENSQAIILYESEKLSTESLLYIKWLLERHKGIRCNKVFFCCSDESKLQPVKALCTTVTLAPPRCEDVVQVLEFIAQQEGIELPHNFAVKIVEKSKNNLRQAIRSFEATCQNKLPLEEDQLILTGWEDEISNIAKNTIEEQSPKQLYNIRRKLQNLMIHNVSPGFIFMCLEAELKSLVDEPLRPGVAKLCKEYNGEPEESNSKQTKKNALSFLKVEEFIAKFMSWYKNSSGTSHENVLLEAGI